MKTETHLARRLDEYYPLAVENVGAAGISAYGIAEVVGASASTPGQETYTVREPTGSPGAEILIVGPLPIAAGSEGIATRRAPFPVAVNASPNVGDDWGPTSGTSIASSGGTGLTALGGATDGLAMFRFTSGEGGGVDHPVVQIANNTFFARSTMSVVGLDTPRYTFGDAGFLSRVQQFNWSSPVAGDAFAILMADIPAQGAVISVGDAAVTGVVPCLLDVKSATHIYADCITNNTTYLESGDSGQCRILWKQNQGLTGASALGVQPAIVELDARGDSQTFHCHVTSSVAAAPNASPYYSEATIYVFMEAGEEVTATEQAARWFSRSTRTLDASEYETVRGSGIVRGGVYELLSVDCETEKYTYNPPSS